ncbi:MAG: tRNA pseudouridine(13) synthase TruD [Candidatus Micrarchaeum sp. ARMAN-1]|nr:MAG: tRNA pseudouridine(13) synthase TruD [Candidatus Micrarchaeum sp. ARMAN-1]
MEGNILILKSSPEDFIVKEITRSYTVLEQGASYSREELKYPEGNEFTIFAMQKRGWNTLQALGAIASASGKGKKSVGFAGTKDRRAVSVQLCSIRGVEPDKLLSLQIPDIKINFAWRSAEQVRLGDLEGNSFEITAKSTIGAEKAMDVIKANGLRLGGTFPNYYGTQRFGNRKNNVEIGLSILRGDLERAAMLFLTDSSNEGILESKEARKRLAEEMDFGNAMNYFPRHLKYERKIISYIAKYGPNYREALRVLPRQLLMMFVHSVESEIFNKVVRSIEMGGHTKPEKGDLSCGLDGYGFPDYSKISKYEKGPAVLVSNVIGYETEHISEYENAALEDYGLTKESFKCKSMPELRAKGSYRAAFTPYKSFTAESRGEEIKMKFSLPSGSYATVFISELQSQSSIAD